MNLKRFFDTNDFKLLKSEKDSTLNETHDYYEFKDKFDTAFKRTAHLYFKNSKCDFYIQPTHDLDEWKKKHLVKFQMHTPKQYSREMKETIVEYTLVYLIQEVKVDQAERDKIIPFFK